MIKNLCRILCFVLFFNFYVMNFGMEVQTAYANSNTQNNNNIIDISSGRDINFDLSSSGSDLLFDFTRYLSSGDRVESLVLKRTGKKTEDISISKRDNNNDKVWKTKFIAINGDTYELHATINIGGVSRKVLFNFVYNNYDEGNDLTFEYKDNNKLEITFPQSLLDLYSPEDQITFRMGQYSGNQQSVISDKVFKVKDIRDRKKVIDNVKNSGGGMYARLFIRGREYCWKVYAERGKFKVIKAILESGKILNNGDFEFKIKVTNSDVSKVTNSEWGTWDSSKKTITYVSKSNGTKINHLDALRLNLRENEQNGMMEGSFSVTEIRKLEKLNAKVRVVEAENKVSVTMDRSMIPFFNKNSASNKIYVYELNSNFAKGPKVCEKTSNVSDTLANDMVIGSGIKFSPSKNYLVEFNNGSRTISMPFIYTTLTTGNNTIQYTSAKVTWEYPSGYTPVSGDKVEIFLRDEDGGPNFPATPKVSLVQGTSNVNLTNTKSADITQIAPSTRYEAKVVLSNQRGSVTGYTQFDTKTFALKKYIDIQNCDYDTSSYWHVARHRAKNMTVTWDFSPDNMTFYNGDKVEIWIKPNGGWDFSGYPTTDKYRNPVFSRVHGNNVDLNNVKSGDIVIPSWLDHYHVDVIYTIGGKKIITAKPDNVQGESGYNRKTVEVMVKTPNVQVTDIQQTSAKLTWEYDHGFTPSSDSIVKYVPEAGQLVRAHIKKISSPNDNTTSGFDEEPLFEYEHGLNNMDISRTKEFALTNLDAGQSYRVRFQHVLQKANTFDTNSRVREFFVNFTTGAFEITDLRAVQKQRSPIVDLSWNTRGEVTFGAEDKVNVYLKEGSTSEYPTQATKTFTIGDGGVINGNGTGGQASTREGNGEGAQDVESDGTQSQTIGANRTEIELPKYNTPYNIKVEYVIKGKKIHEFVQAEASGELGVIITDINTTVQTSKSSGTWKAKVKWTYPEGYVKSTRINDKVKIVLIKQPEQEERITTNTLTYEVNVTSDSNSECEFNTLEQEKIYNVVVTFINNNTEVNKVETIFKCTKDLQVTSLIASDVKAKEVNLSWDYFPDKDPDEKSKIKIYAKEVGAGVSTRTEDENQGYTELLNVGFSSSGNNVNVPTEIVFKNTASSRDGNNTTTVQLNKDKFKGFKSIKLKGLSPNKEYSVFVVYEHKKTRQDISGGVGPQGQEDNLGTEEQDGGLQGDEQHVDGPPSGDSDHSDQVPDTDSEHEIGGVPGVGVPGESEDNLVDPQSGITGDVIQGQDTIVPGVGALGARSLRTETEQIEKPYAEVKFKTKVNTFKASVFTSDQAKATFGWEYPPGYALQAGDQVDIFIKEVRENGNSETRSGSNNNGYGDALLTLVHGTGEGKYDLNEVTRVDVSGLTPESKYKAKVQFTMTGDNTPISTEVNISTKSFAIKSFEVDSYEEYDILVRWAVEPENMKFGDADKVEIFVKLASDNNYPQEPSYMIQGHPSKDGDPDIDTTFSDYVLAETIGEEQNMKLVYTVGDKKYEKELTFTNTINPVKASLFSKDATRALIQFEAPDNYEFVSGDKLLIYAKDEFAEGQLETENFLAFEGVQSDSLSIADDMRLIELSYLLPEAAYEVLVKLELQDGEVAPAKFEFTTGALGVTDVTLQSIKHNSNVISWNYGDKEIDFYKDESKYEHTDKLIIAHREASEGPIPEELNAIKQLTHKEILGPDIKSVKDFNVEVKDPSKDYEVVVLYELGGLKYIKRFKTSNLVVSSSEDAVENNTAAINWKYPSNVSLGDADKTEVFIRKKNDTEYPSTPSNSSTGTGTTSYTFNELEGETEYVAKVQIVKEGLNIDPVEVNFTTKANPAKDVIIEQVEDKIQGTKAKFSIPTSDVEVNKDGEIQLSMGDEQYKGFKVKLSDDGTSFIIEPTIPKKRYQNVEVQIPLKDGTSMTITIKEFTTEPENITQDWLSNAYWFAFERFPDEEGYNYWYEHRMLTKKLNGEYFLKNLMFAEDEFTNRNLADRDLIAALYQIVVNRDFDEEGLNFWISIYNENLKNAQGNKKLAQETLVDRMVHEPEFGKLCDKAGIFWRQSDQDAAGVVA